MKDSPMNQGLLEASLSGDFSSLAQLSGEALAGVAAGGNSAAHITAKLGHSEFLTAILARCPSLLCQRNSVGDTPLHCAARVGSETCVRILLEEWRRCRQSSSSVVADGIAPPTASHNPEVGEDKVDACLANLPQWVNRRGNTALHEAVRSNHLAVAKSLLSADPLLAQVKNSAGESVLDIATEISSSEIIDFLHKFQSQNPHELEGRTVQYARRSHDSQSLRSKQSRRSSRPKRVQRGEPIRGSGIIVNKLIITAVSIACLTFASAVALPIDAEEGTVTTLSKRIAYIAFLISDTLAMVCSAIIVVMLVRMVCLSLDAQLHAILASQTLMRVAIGSLITAFATGLYAVVDFDDTWLAVIVCSTSGFVPLAIYEITWWPIAWSTPLVAPSGNAPGTQDASIRRE